MRRVIIAAVVSLAACFMTIESAQAQLRASTDPFESRRRDAEYRQELRRQQRRQQQRVVPTFTIPQPSYNPYAAPWFNGGSNFDGRFGRYPEGRYIAVPGSYQNVGGSLVWVPPHYQFVPY